MTSLGSYNRANAIEPARAQDTPIAVLEDGADRMLARRRASRVDPEPSIRCEFARPRTKAVQRLTAVPKWLTRPGCLRGTA
jgi:hypothetical protein